MMQLFFHGIFKCFTVNIQKLTSNRLVLQKLMPKNNKIYGSYQLSLVSIHASFQSTSVCVCLRTQSMAFVSPASCKLSGIICFLQAERPALLRFIISCTDSTLMIVFE